MKSYTLRINLKLKTPSDNEAKRLAEIYIKELPRMDDFQVDTTSIFCINDKKIIQEN